MPDPNLWFACVAEAVCSRGQAALVGRTPFAAVSAAINDDAFVRLGSRLPAGTSPADVLAGVARLDESETVSLAQAAADASSLADDQRQALATFLAQVPAAVRATLRRPSDPEGRTTPGGWSPLDGPPVTPVGPSRFNPGDRPLIGVPLELVERLGAGGFGEVWKARNVEVRHLPHVALKFCLDPVTHERLERHEAELTALVGQVPVSSGPDGVVTLRNAYLKRDPSCLEYEYIAGGDLAGLLREWQQLGPPPYHQATHAVQRLARVLGALHRHTPRVVHRDLKPSNILVQRTADGSYALRVADFGIGGVASERTLERDRTGQTSRGEFLTAALLGACTPLYASPQQREGKSKPDPRDDVHALGVIWFQLLVGDVKRPVGADLADDLAELGVADGLIQVLKACVANKLEKRPKDGIDLAERIGTSPRSTPSVRIPEPRLAGSTQDLVVGRSPLADTSSLATAISRVAFGGRITLEPGEYTESVRIEKDVVIVAEPGVTLVGVAGAALRIAANVSVRGLKVSASRDESASSAVDIVSGRLELIDCDLIGRRFVGLWINGASSRVVARRCHFHDADIPGVFVDGVLLSNSARGEFDECVIEGNSRNGLEIQTHATVVMHHCRVQRNGHSGLWFNEGGTGTVELCHIRENGFSGVALWLDADPVIRRCQIQANGHAGVAVRAKGTGTVEDCDLTGNGRGAFTFREADCRLRRQTDNHTDEPTTDVETLWRQATSLSAFDTDAAIDVAGQVLARSPAHRHARELLSRLALERAERRLSYGRFTETIADCQAVLNVDPGHELASSMLADAERGRVESEIAEREMRVYLLVLDEAWHLPRAIPEADLVVERRLNGLAQQVCGLALQEAIRAVDVGQEVRWQVRAWRTLEGWGARIPADTIRQYFGEPRSEQERERNRARLHLVNRDIESATGSIRSVLEQTPDDAVARHYLGLTLAIRGETDAARVEFSRAAQAETEPGVRERIQRALRWLR